MVETLKLNGTGKLLVDDDVYNCFINIDLLDKSIRLYGDFKKMIDKKDKYTTDIFAFFKTKKLLLNDICLDSNYGEIKGEINNFFISSVGFRGSNFLSGSVVAKIFHIKPKFNYDELKITPRFSKLTFMAKKTEKTYNELWFRIPKKSMEFRSDVYISNGKKLFFFSDDDIVIVKCLNEEIVDIEIDKIRSALSFIIGTEVVYIFGFRNGYIEINNIGEKDVENKLSLFHFDYRKIALNAFINYVYSIGQSDYEKFENSLYLYLSAKSKSISMNSLLSLLFVCIESMFDNGNDISLEAKILKLFNLNNPKEYDQTKNTISLSINQDLCHALSKIRNMLIHEGIAADKIYNRISTDPAFTPIVIKCDNNCFDLFFYIISLLDKYFINKILYSGEYIDVGNDFSREKTIR